MKLSNLPRLEIDNAAVVNPDVVGTLFALLAAINTPIALSIYLRLKHNVVDYPVVHPHNYDLVITGIYKYKQDIQALALVNKSAILDRGVDTKLVAFANFLASEKQCKVVNQQLRERARSLKTDFTSIVLNNARTFIAKTLGEADIDFNLTVSGGSTATVRGKEQKLLVNKLYPKPSITRAAIKHFLTAIWRDPAAYAYATHHNLINSDGAIILENFNIIEHEEVDFAPKNWKTDRLIKLQATLNMSLQRCAGKHISHRIYHELGRRLEETPDIHHNIMKTGMFSGYSISTIDVKAASDSITIELLKSILPPDWFTLLSDLRHKSWSYTFEEESGDKKKKEKRTVFARGESFSAMGNGFTFELETLIFMSICHGVLKALNLRANAFSVFGDDIIIPTRAANALVDVLFDIGFETNNEKTFINSPFLESCGCDRFYNIDCRPIYIKDFDKGLRGTYALLNRVRGIGVFLDRDASAIYRVWASIIRKIGDVEPKLLCAGPEGFGDSFIVASRREAERLKFGHTPKTHSYSLTTVGISKRLELVPWLAGDENNEDNTFLELAYMCLHGDSKGQVLTKDTFSSRWSRYAICVWDTRDWL